MAIAGASSVTAVAGCASDGGDGSPAPASGTVTGTAAGGDFPYPDGYSAEGVVDARAAFESHVSFLVGLSNATTSLTRRRYDGGDERVVTSSTTRVDTEGRWLVSEYDDHAHDKELFFTDGSLYLYSNRRDGRVDPRETPLFGGEPPTTFRGTATYFWSILVPSVLDAFSLRRAGTGRHAGRSVMRYAVAGTDGGARSERYNPGGELLVSSDGGILRLTVEYSTTEGGTPTENGDRYEFALGGVGTTAVESPSWFESGSRP